MRITVIRGLDLTAEHRRRWSRWQQDDPDLASPFLCPEFTLVTAAVRDDVHVGLLQDGDDVVGFLPFQRSEPTVGEAIAIGMSDFQGVVSAPGVPWTAAELIAGCGLGSWKFNHLLACQTRFERYHREVRPSHYLDLSRGYEAYVRQLGDTRLFKDLARKSRKVEREVGPLRFAAHVDDQAALHALMQLKSAQYLRFAKVDRFTIPWVVALLEGMLQCQRRQFGGLLSVLHAGDELVAAHMGLRSHRSWHWWFPAYDLRFAKYSPGQILLLRTAERAAALGIDRIDLGRGEAPYKERLGTGCTWVAEGCVVV